MRIIRCIVLLALTGIAAAQVPAPTTPVQGTLGANGNFPLLNSGTFPFPSDATFTPTFPNTTCIVCKVTSSVSLTATRNLVMPGPGSPAKTMTFNITNATTGGQAIQVIASSGTGVTIANGTSAWVWFDGTNYKEIDPPSSGGSGTVSGQAAQTIPLGTSATVIGNQSHLTDDGTKITSTEKIVAPSYVSGTPSAGALAALPTGAVGAAFDESATAGVPAAGVDYLRADSVAHCFKQSLNGGSEACIGAGSGLPSGNVGQIVTNTTGSTTYAAQGQLVYQQSGDTIASIEANAQCATACTYVVTGPQTLTLTGNHTMAAPVRIRFEAGGLWTVNGAFTLTFSNTPSSDSLTQHLAGSSTLAGFSGAVPVEWFGALGFTTKSGASGGSDYTAQIQKTINSITRGGWAQLQALYYKASSGIAITTSSVGIHGLLGRDSYPANAVVSSIVSTSALGTIISANGTSFGAGSIFYNTFKNFSIERLTQPTGTTPEAAIGLSLQYAWGFTVDTVTSNDSLVGFFMNGSPSIGMPGLLNANCNNGLLTVNSYVSGQFVACHDFDSENGTPADSVNAYHGNGAAFNTAQGSGVTTVADWIHGSAINDINLYAMFSAGTSYGNLTVYNGGGASDTCADIHNNNFTYDAASVSAIKISGLTGACLGSYNGNNGYATVVDPGVNAIDIEDSFGVAFNNIQIFSSNSSASVQVGLYAHNASNLTLTGIQCQAFTTSTCVQLDATTGATLSASTADGIVTSPMTSGFVFTNSSTGNSILSNVVSGYVTTGYSFDGSSLANNVVSTCSGANVTTCISGTPTGKNASYFGDVYSNGSLLSGGGSYPQVTSYISGTTGNNSAGLKFLSGSGTLPCYDIQIAGQQWAAGCNATYVGGSAPAYVTSYSAQLHRLFPCGISAITSSCQEVDLAANGTAAATLPNAAVAYWAQWDPVNSVHQTWIDPQLPSPTFPGSAVFCANPSCNLSWDALGNETALSGAFTTAKVGGQNVCVANGTNCLFFLSNSSWNIQSALFATVTMLGAVHNTPYLNSLNASIIVRTSGAISCTVAPVVNLMDLGTSATTVYGSATSIGSVTTATSDGVFTGTSSSALQNGHYYGIGFSAGTCITAPTFDISVQAVW